MSDGEQKPDDQFEYEPQEAEAPDGPTAEAAVRALQSLLDAQEKELSAAKEGVLRARADAENIRKRAEREIADMSKFAVTGFARDLVSVLENLQRATDSIPAELKEAHPAVASLATGVEMTLKELLSVFEKHGIRRLYPMGEKFDHNYHQAVAQIETPDAEAGTIVQVMQAGYVIHDRLLKPAMVGVAAGGDSKQVDTKA